MIADLDGQGAIPAIAIGVGPRSLIFYSRDELDNRQLQALLLEALAILRTEKAIGNRQ